MRLTVPLLALLIACDGGQTDDTGKSKDDPDLDLDGIPASVDCDDNDADRSPAELEVCDGKDNDCDDDIDEDAADALDYFADDDLDTFGDPDDVVTSCSNPGGGRVLNSADCDDDEPFANPQMGELCDGIDNDCDDAIDEDLPPDPPVHYRDHDGDGYGDPQNPVVACIQPSGYVSNNDDCNDGDADVNPGVPEDCVQAIDEDCSGSINDEDAEGCELFFRDSDGDGYGLPGDFKCLCTAEDVYTADNFADCNDTTDIASPDGSEVCGDGLDNDCTDGELPCDVVELQNASAQIAGDNFADQAGAAVAAGGDIDGDGLLDVLIGAPHDTDLMNDEGHAYAIFGPVLGEFDLFGADVEIRGDGNGDLAGAALRGAFDMDGDGKSDILVGAPNENTAGSGAGAIYLVHGNGPDFYDLDEDEDRDARVIGQYADDHLGAAVDVGEFAGDSRVDLVVGAPGQRENGPFAGAVYLLEGPILGDTDIVFSATAKVVGERLDDQAGTSVVNAGDLDGDGTDDLVIGAPGTDDPDFAAGSVYVVQGPITGTVQLADADVTITGVRPNDAVGSVVANVGDLDEDGRPDFAFSSPTRSEDRGIVWVVTDTAVADGTVAVSDFVFVGEAPGFLLGTSVAGVGDFDLDGVDDILLGAPGEAAGQGAGAALLFAGSSALSGVIDNASVGAKFQGESTGDQAGYAVAAAGDIDDNGHADIIVGAPGRDENSTGAGHVYVFYGYSF